ncbi:uncharacterized protein LOC112594103 [Melanaphis sacchari]|uniref:uncharacterized protein LOC112594103 n=1 Tax=Melanaphis sacchari TaxID=742174 RepID=UPI000DC14141|nr:uncharacterized protein LOC112594103 [Melanaphis sacchari]
MTFNPLVVCTTTAVLWLSSASTAADVFPAAGQVVSADTAEELSLAEISRVIEGQRLLMSSSTPFDLLGALITGNNGDDPVEGRGKKTKPAKMAMMMAGTAAASMIMMKAAAAIKLFIIHAFFATKLGLIIGAYLLVCKLMEMKQAPAKKSVQVKWVSAPSHFDEHPPQMSHMMSHYPDSSQSSYEPHQEPQQQQQQPVEQYGPPPQHQQYSSFGDFGGGGGGGGNGVDMQAHYSHVSPVTYRPTANRNQSDNIAKSVGRTKK